VVDLNSPIEFVVNLSTLVIQNGANDIGDVLEDVCRTNGWLNSCKFRHFIATDTIDHSFEPSRNHSTSTHRARLCTCVHNRLSPFLLIQFLTRSVGEVEFGVPTNIILCEDMVRINHDDCIVTDEYATEGSITAAGSLTSKLEGAAHM
jgi:hypothetical protein